MAEVLLFLRMMVLPLVNVNLASLIPNRLAPSLSNLLTAATGSFSTGRYTTTVRYALIWNPDVSSFDRIPIRKFFLSPMLFGENNAWSASSECLLLQSGILVTKSCLLPAIVLELNHFILLKIMALLFLLQRSNQFL